MTSEFGRVNGKRSRAARGLKVEVLDREFVYLRMLTGRDVEEIQSIDGLPESDGVPRMVALCLANEDGSRRYPEPTSDDLAAISDWPLVVLTRIVNESKSLNGLVGGDDSGN